ncbi:MAG: DUF4175 family protein, partial [bacterium]|nr:DUF4175 family protein [bacterium]
EAIAMVYPPSYTGISPYTLKNSFFLNVPEGSSVKYTFDFTDNIESVKTSYGNVSYLGRRLIYEKIITNDIVEDIIVKPVASSKKVIKININAIKDNPPFARIVSPKSGVYAGEISRIPIIYEYEDDYKVVAAELFIVNEYVNLSKKLKAPVKKAFDEEFIELGTLKGEYVDIYIAIKDDVNPIVYSDKVRINIISKDSVFRKQFEDIKRIEDKVMELLSDEIEVEKYINDMNFQEAFRKQQSLDLKYADFVDTIEKGNFNMPFMNDILNSIKNIKDIDSKELLESISRNDFIKSKEQISDIITQLEKMTHNLTNIKKEFNLSKMLEDVSDAKKLASSISVSNDLEEIKELVKKIFDRFNSVMEKIKNMPALLPEDFVNRYDAAKLDFSQAMNKMNELMSALSSGNLERIKELANELLNELENLEKSLSSIAQPTMELSHILNRINDIIAKEKTIADDTYKLKKDFASSYKEKLLKMQSSTYEDFKKIVKTQKEQEVKSSMLKTIEFIKTENFTTAKNEVETILERLKDYKYRNFYVKELEVYELLNSSVSYAAKLKAPYLNNLSMKQHEIMKDTLRLKNEVEDVFSKAILPPDIHTRLKRAANYMDSASKFLKIGNIDKAYQDELNALKELIEASKRNYSAASGSMGGAVGATSRPGFYGIRIDEVKFPRKEDYKKPYQLRDEILNSLKERKPEESKEFIEKYFEELIR